MRSAAFSLFLSLSIGLSAQTTHQIRGLDFYYLPDTLYMQPGDSVHFDPLGGLHNMTETDYANWLISQAFTNGGFDTEIGADTTFAIDTAGTYYFVCLPHGYVGMKGVLIVEDPVSVPPAPGLKFIVFPNPTNGLLTVQGLASSASLRLLDAFGREVLSSLSADLDLSLMANGLYFVEVNCIDGVFRYPVFKQY